MKVIYITGSPGTGKSTVASHLAELLKAKYVDLGAVALEKDFITGYDRERKTSIIDMEKLLRYLKELMESEAGDLILDTHFCVRLPVKADTFIFVLRLEPFKLVERLRAKGFPEKKISENMWAEILDFCLQEALTCEAGKVHEIDTTDKNVGAVVGEIVEVIEERKKPSAGSIDWLSRLEREGKIEQLIKSAEGQF